MKKNEELLNRLSLNSLLRPINHLEGWKWGLEGRANAAHPHPTRFFIGSRGSLGY